MTEEKRRLILAEILKLNEKLPTGRTYPLEEVQKLVRPTGEFMRRINAGQLRGTLGMPKKELGESSEQFTDRVTTVDESQVSHVFHRVTIEGNKLIGLIELTGPKAIEARQLLDNAPNDYQFALRSFCNIDKDGIVSNIRAISFDLVNQSGTIPASIADRGVEPFPPSGDE